MYIPVNISYASYMCRTGFVKTCIVYTSKISTLVTHIKYLFGKTDVKLGGVAEPLFIYNSLKFQVCVTFPVIFMDPQMNRIGCVNYACFLKSGHIRMPNILTS